MQSPSTIEEAESPEENGIQRRLRRLIERYPFIFRAAKFAGGSAIGFVETEIILMIGTYFLYGSLSAPPNAFSSLSFLALNIAAFVTGVTVAFFINETLIGHVKSPKINYDLLVRLLKFQLIFLSGNLAMIAVELLMLREFAFLPILGIVVGAIATFPLSYFFSMRFVWQISRSDVKTVPRGLEAHEIEPCELQIKLHQIFLDNPIYSLPERLLAPLGDYCLNVQKYRVCVFPGKDRRETRIEFSLKMDVECDN